MKAKDLRLLAVSMIGVSLFLIIFIGTIASLKPLSNEFLRTILIWIISFIVIIITVKATLKNPSLKLWIDFGNKSQIITKIETMEKQELVRVVFLLIKSGDKHQLLPKMIDKIKSEKVDKAIIHIIYYHYGTIEGKITEISFTTKELLDKLEENSGRFNKKLHHYLWWSFFYPNNISTPCYSKVKLIVN